MLKWSRLTASVDRTHQDGASVLGPPIGDGRAAAQQECGERNTGVRILRTSWGVQGCVCVHVNADLVCSSAELLDLSNTDHNSKYLLYTRI